MSIRSALPLLMLALAPAALAQTPTGVTPQQYNEDYAACMALARQNPDAALARAQAWWQAGANFAARHCIGLALVHKESYLQGGKILEDLAVDARGEIAHLKADLYAQAGQAYYLGGVNERAIAMFDRALALKPRDPELLIDRAIARDEIGQHFEAIDDLNTAIDMAPDRADAWLYRAAAYRHVGSLDLALEDANRAVALSQRSPEALFERARIKAQRKDAAGARADYQSLIKLAPNSPQAKEAREHLKTLAQDGEPAAPQGAAPQKPPARR